MSAIIYKGKSLINNDNIVVIAVSNSKNSKTGNVIQTYILVDNEYTPNQNVYSLKDEAICGNCIHRRGTGGSCYVNIGQGPTQVYKAYKKGTYKFNPVQAQQESRDRIVRLGTYGDPAAVPRYVWDNLLKYSAGHTGYTHQWNNSNIESIADIVMASADSEKDRIAAKKKGYRTFRIRKENEPLMKKEFICPASEEGNKRKQCFECKACNGGYNTNKGDPVIITHGILKTRFRKSNGLGYMDMGAFDFIKNPIKKFLTVF